MKTIWTLLKGKKTYIVGALSIILGYMNNDVNLIMTGLIALGLRDAIK